MLGYRWRWPLSICAQSISAKLLPTCSSGWARTSSASAAIAIWTPKWLIEKFMAYELPEDLKEEYHVDLTLETRRKILGENAARLYGIDIPAKTAKLKNDAISAAHA